MTRALSAALIGVIVWAVIATRAEARVGQHKTLRSTRFLAEHTQHVLRSKCRATYSSLRGSRATWIIRHRIAHRLKRGRCQPRLVVRHLSSWLCIHSYEGSWTDSGDPYWGGLQMDRTFMLTYAPRWLLRKGWANTWTPTEQMYVAERAHDSGRGYGPWPTTARMCGLL